jgi:D-alanine-D-alanine ligase
MRIAVLTGGTSAERDVAIASAVQIVAALRSRGHVVVVIDTAHGPMMGDAESRFLKASVGTTPPSIEHLEDLERKTLAGLGELPAVRDVDVLFLALHGGRGEDGTLQALLDLLGLAYTGSNAMASAVAMDKDLSKRLFRDAGIPTPAWFMTPVDIAEVTDRLGWPVIVKPSKQGSTVGLSLVRRAEDLAPAIALAGEYDDEVMVEEFIAGRELTVGVLDDRALAVGEIIPRHEIFDYECKYTPGMATEVFPASLDSVLAERTRELALAAHRCLKLGGYSRIDFRLPEARGSDPICLEANTLPGMTATSLLPQSAAAVGIDLPELCERICLAALDRSKV